MEAESELRDAERSGAEKPGSDKRCSEERYSVTASRYPSTLTLLSPTDRVIAKLTRKYGFVAERFTPQRDAEGHCDCLACTA